MWRRVRQQFLMWHKTASSTVTINTCVHVSLACSFLRLFGLFVCLFVGEFNDPVMEYLDYLSQRDSRRDFMADGHVITLSLLDRRSHVSILSRVGWLLVTIMTGSSSDDWILLAFRLQHLLITLNHYAIAMPHTLQSLHTNPLKTISTSLH
jgi:hypothetical protein